LFFGQVLGIYDRRLGFLCVLIKSHIFYFPLYDLLLATLLQSILVHLIACRYRRFLLIFVAISVRKCH
jgi:hypothetical protein